KVLVRLVRWTRTSRAHPRPSLRLFSAFGGVATLIVILSFAVVREAQKETHIFHVWYAIHAGAFDANAFRRPLYLLTELEEVNKLGGNEPGTVTIYASWALAAYVERTSYYENLH